MLQETIIWQETKNNVTIDCSLDIAVHTSNADTILLTVPGVDGSLDGYENKYVRIAETIQKEHGAAIVRMENPFITSFHWESNIRRALDYIQKNAKQICGTTNFNLRIMAHSAGASVVSHVAWEYPFITHILLTNPAVDLNFKKIIHGLENFNERATILIGSKDDAVKNVKELQEAKHPDTLKIQILDDIDHDFSGEIGMQLFLDAPKIHLLKLNPT